MRLLRIHDNEMHSNIKPYKCDECDYTTKTKGSIAIHKKAKHSDDRPHACVFCNKAFKTKATLDVHVRSHTGEKPFKCEICDTAFAAKIRLTRHLLTHTGEKPELQNPKFAREIRTTEIIGCFEGPKNVGKDLSRKSDP